MRWTVHGERPLYVSDWVTLKMVDVELPDGRRFEHHVVQGRPAAGVVVHDPARGVLLLWRHRFITDEWGWEIPAGVVDEGEDPAEAAAREALEETGWRVTGELQPLSRFAPMSGWADKHFHVFYARGAEHIGDPVDINEATEIAWVPVARVRELIQAGELREGMGLVGLLHALAFGLLDG
jgi:8-oxo-dGTP pyrophosphatase MutT (NUDIX family)